MPKSIALSQGKFAIVNDGDFEWLNQWKWYATGRGSLWYARTSLDGRNIRMHRLILGLSKGEQVDHINGDGLDNRRRNLRICTQSQNQMNRRKRPQCSSKYKGVYWAKARQQWHAQITIDGKVQGLGRFHNEQDAGLAYNAAASKHFGEFARINVIRKEKQT